MADLKGSGLWHTPAYQVSGIPYVTSSLTIPPNTMEPLEINFPFVTIDFLVKNDGANSIRLGYTRNGIKAIENYNYITIEPGMAFEAKYRVSKLYLLCDTTLYSSGSVSAGLSTVESKYLTDNWSGSVYQIGVG